MRPIIGITAGFTYMEEKHFLTDFYVQAVENLGGIPMILPSVGTSLVSRVYDLVDGIIFSGGSDIDPGYYGQNPLKGLGEIIPKRDKFELFLAKQALGGTKPTLGICRGLQLLCVAAGGQIYQDLEEITNNDHNQKAPKWYPYHEVKIEKESKLYNILEKNRIKVNSFHHQGVKESGIGLKAVAFSEDGLIEAVESSCPDKLIIGVQWHPECSWDSDKNSRLLLKAFIDRARGEKE